MNFLAHIYLSQNDEKTTVGNFIGDFVKGKAFEDYPDDIKKGILLHREIDRYTDTHDIVTNSKERLRPRYHHYAPVITDVYYDHFLASLWSNYHQEDLGTYTKQFYLMMNRYKQHIPSTAQHMLSYMARDNWLFNYQYVDGIKKALTGMANRTTFDSKMELAAQDLKADYALYQEEFEAFFPDLIRHSSDYFVSLS